MAKHATSMLSTLIISVGLEAWCLGDLGESTCIALHLRAGYRHGFRGINLPVAVEELQALFGAKAMNPLININYYFL